MTVARSPWRAPDQLLFAREKGWTDLLERASSRGQGLMRLLGAEEGWCVIHVPFHDGLTQQERYFHAAVTGAC